MEQMRVGKVYKIIATQGNECYVGSTFNTTRDRFQAHKDGYKKWKKICLKFCSSFKIFDKYGIENCRIILIKEYTVVDRAHLEGYEQLWLKKLKAINEREPSARILTKQRNRFRCRQFYENNKETINSNRRDEYKQYYELNKDKLNEYNRRRYHENHQKVLDEKRDYRESNRAAMSGYSKKYYSQNKNIISNKGKVLISCECGSSIRKDGVHTHKKSIKHRKFVESQANKH